MSKKPDKSIILKDSDLSNTVVSIIEANQTQQTVILRFTQDSNIHKYSLSKCKINPLLNSPEKVEYIYSEFDDHPIKEGKLVYIVFDTQISKNQIDENDDIIIHIPVKEKILLEFDEVFALLESENNELKIIDWSKPIVDEIIPFETLEKLKEIPTKQGPTLNSSNVTEKQFYVKNRNISEQIIPNKSVFNPFYYLILLIFLISILTFITTYNSEDLIAKSIYKFFIISIKNVVIGFVFYKWTLSERIISSKFLILLFFVIVFIAVGIYFVGLYPTILESFILIIITIVFTSKIKENKT